MRIKLSKCILGRLSPTLLNYIKYYEFLHDYEKSFNEIRPAILKAKEIFNNKEILGAEIGVQYGNNALNILNTLNMKKLWLIDIWENYDIYHPKPMDSNINFKGYNYVLNRFKNYPNVHIVKGFSNEISKRYNNNTLDICYIDANHEYNSILQDLYCWFKKVKINGLIGGHDILNLNVLKAVIDFCSLNNQEFFLKPPDFYIIKKINHI